MDDPTLDHMEQVPSHEAEARAYAEEQHGQRCPDCGEIGERTGHMGCQYPQDR